MQVDKDHVAFSRTLSEPNERRTTNDDDDNDDGDDDDKCQKGDMVLLNLQ